jgi:hypothetical protein
MFDEIRDAAFRPRLVDHQQRRQVEMFPTMICRCRCSTLSKMSVQQLVVSVRLNLLNEEYLDRMSCNEFYEYGKIKELYKVGAHMSKFTGDRLS